MTVSDRWRHGDLQRPQRRDPLGSQPGGRHRIGRDGGRPGGLPRRQLDGQLVAADERHLEHPEQEQDHHRQRECQLDRGLAAVAAGIPPAGRRAVPVAGGWSPTSTGHTLSITESMTRSNNRPTFAAPPPAVAQPTTRSATSAAASRTRAYSVVA